MDLTQIKATELSKLRISKFRSPFDPTKAKEKDRFNIFNTGIITKKSRENTMMQKID